MIGHSVCFVNPKVLKNKGTSKVFTGCDFGFRQNANQNPHKPILTLNYETAHN